MSETYEPSRKEVLRAMPHDLRTYLQNDARQTLTDIVSAGKHVAAAGKQFVAFVSAGAQMTVFMNLAPYVIPTLSETLRDKNYVPPKLTMAENVGYTIGSAGGISLLVGQGCLYWYAANHGHAEALLLPVATNALTGLAVVSNRWYTTTRERLTKEHATNTPMPVCTDACTDALNNEHNDE